MTTSTPTATATTPLGTDALIEVFNTLKAFGPRRIDGYQADATPATKARLRMRLDEYGKQDGMGDVVLLVRRYFNTYRSSDWRIVEWQVTAALKMLGTVSEALDAPATEAQRRRDARWDHVQHGDPRCLTEETDGECVCS